jgi:hypothetical protein
MTRRQRKICFKKEVCQDGKERIIQFGSKERFFGTSGTESSDKLCVRVYVFVSVSV